MKDETVLAIYSHMIGYPLYLSAYAFGQIIEFQLENYLNGKDFANEVSRIFKQGRLTPNVWIKQATGNDLTVDPMLEALRKVLKDLTTDQKKSHPDTEMAFFIYIKKLPIITCR